MKKKKMLWITSAVLMTGGFILQNTKAYAVPCTHGTKACATTECYQNSSGTYVMCKRETSADQADGSASYKSYLKGSGQCGIVLFGAHQCLTQGAACGGFNVSSPCDSPPLPGGE